MQSHGVTPEHHPSKRKKKKSFRGHMGAGVGEKREEFCVVLPVIDLACSRSWVPGVSAVGCLLFLSPNLDPLGHAWDI